MIKDSQTGINENISASFREHGYTMVRGLINPDWFYQYVHLLKNKGNLRSDTQVPGSLIATSDPMFGKLLTNILPTIEKHTGSRLYETYAFFRMYDLGHELKRHTDRYECEVTVSLCLGYKGESWPICIEDRNGKEQIFTLEAGDAVIFKGIELPHWRAPNTFGECAYVFLHYVDRNGPYTDHRKGGPYWSNYVKEY